MKNQRVSLVSKGLLIIVSGLFMGSVFFPLWQIQLDAPQYPEGLVLRLYADKIGGDVDIINGLNHYIGMATLHTENFFEFTILTSIIVGFGLVSLLLLFLDKKKYVGSFLVLFFLFVILSAIDFYRWNYEYGHNLDPNAAIKVLGMSYQPPLVGYKQLLNFGAYSIPDKGGWMLITAGIILFFIMINEKNIQS
ncbi:hypothetical protein [Flavobacterium columnare]|uniref:Copper chaperone NosL n=1 Tax=Flavobacterium columnare TaxID=996 RepID=A0AAI8GC84_9FLAO|nr:hypothetical protein [Flavobacterium columnare]AMO21297.1 hypothetical protein UN65_14095 [Flavobacterium columnare]AUX19320.1 hypothetical protein AQ623_14400 [Flavobacterium columnare]QOG58407.1 hypothetical protein HUE29_14150 [Flavobacterium columnare]QOG61130.1 hypothetical protein HUE30_14150 [Flavobacterium columnare]QOG63852.1 hypothetical protein HUE31_14150 [Flavobacterium columnare]